MEVGKGRLDIGVTGGIGTGKTIVCKIFEVLGYPVFYADDEAKKVMMTDDNLIANIKLHFGEEAYFNNGEVNRKLISAIVFKDKKKLNLLNSLVHPATLKAYEHWKNKQRSKITLKEAALLFETDTYKLSDYNILVVAPKELKIARVIVRDNITKEQVIDRMNKQMGDPEKLKLANFVIENDEIQALIPQVLKVEDKLKDLQELKK